jgi:hypothetical protein
MTRDRVSATDTQSESINPHCKQLSELIQFAVFLRFTFMGYFSPHVTPLVSCQQSANPMIMRLCAVSHPTAVLFCKFLIRLKIPIYMQK